VNVTDPVGGTRDATGPVSVTVATQDAGVPGDVPFGVQLIESVDGFAATAGPTSTSANVDTIATTSRRDRFTSHPSWKVHAIASCEGPWASLLIAR
jgi:hypothetical protein